MALSCKLYVYSKFISTRYIVDYRILQMFSDLLFHRIFRMENDYQGYVPAKLEENIRKFMAEVNKVFASVRGNKVCA